MQMQMQMQAKAATTHNKTERHMSKIMCLS